MGQKWWKSAYNDVNGVAQGRVQLGSWGTAGKRKGTVQHSTLFLIVASTIGWR